VKNSRASVSLSAAYAHALDAMAAMTRNHAAIAKLHRLSRRGIAGTIHFLEPIILSSFCFDAGFD
jgi:hypothetical protein